MAKPAVKVLKWTGIRQLPIERGADRPAPLPRPGSRIPAPSPQRRPAIELDGGRGESAPGRKGSRCPSPARAGPGRFDFRIIIDHFAVELA